MNASTLTAAEQDHVAAGPWFGRLSHELRTAVLACASGSATYRCSRDKLLVIAAR